MVTLQILTFEWILISAAGAGLVFLIVFVFKPWKLFKRKKY